jgi:hypothetical protein
MFWLKLVSNFIKILREGQTPAQVAGGFALGSILGLSPMLTLQGLLVWLVILVLDVNLSAATLSLLVFSLVAFIFDPVFHHLGYFLLVDVESLKGVWTTLYNGDGQLRVCTGSLHPDLFRHEKVCRCIPFDGRQENRENENLSNNQQELDSADLSAHPRTGGVT